MTLTDVTSITINFDKDLQVTPQSDEFKKNYQTWERIKFGLKFFGFIILIFCLSFYSKSLHFGGGEINKPFSYNI